jgi:hypothetical protein
MLRSGVVWMQKSSSSPTSKNPCVPLNTLFVYGIDLYNGFGVILWGEMFGKLCFISYR